MSNYNELIQQARLFRDVKSYSTTGDADYPGTAFEVCDPEDVDELFHVVVDSAGERQVLFFAAKADYRLPLELLEKLIARAREVVELKESYDGDEPR